MHASRPQVESRGHKVDVPGTIRPTICLRDGPTEGRHDKTRRKARKKLEKKRKEKQKREQRRSEKTNKHFYVQLVGQGRHKRLEGRQRKRGKSINKTHEGKNKHQLEHRVDAEMQSTGVPSTWQGTGQHRKEQRLELRKYGSHFSRPENAPCGYIFAWRLFAARLARHAHAHGAPRV